MKRFLGVSPVKLIGSRSLTNGEIRRLVAMQALLLTDLLQRKYITLRYAEQCFFNLDTVKSLERRKLWECVEIIDWGMQLEDWEEYTPRQMKDAFHKISEMSSKILFGASERAAKAKRA
jgi:hypothetical protein